MGSVEDITEDPMEAIAVVGIATGFPQEITSPSALWKVIMEKRSTATEFPKSRMDIGSMYHPDAERRGQVSTKRGHFLHQDLAAFDAPFFSTSTTDAASMDPQQRLLLEYTYLALENAGIPMEQVAGSRTSVYTGSFSTDWQQLTYRDAEECATTAATGVTTGLNANRISWFFDLLGPSANIDTACSSSLVCLDLGCQGLRSRNEDMSIVAGSNIVLSPDSMHSLTNLNMLSSDGECYSFDHRANGYSRGEGIGVLVLKRVSDAIRHGDTIRGIIRNSGCNQDGRTPSVTLPNAISQAALIRRCYEQARISMEPVRFFEAHGTGTPVGDPTEATGFGSVFRHVRSAADPLWVGAIKSNIGHLEGASGIAGVVKTLLVLEKGIIPPNTNFESINDNIDAEFLHLRFPTEPTPWPGQGTRRASVNSFGNGGTNAHVILDDVYHFLKARGLKANHCTVREPPTHLELARIISGTPNTVREHMLSPRVLVFSAIDEGAIFRQAESYARHFASLALLENEQQQYLDNLAYSLSYRRSRFAWRSFAVVKSLSDIRNLEKLVAKPKTVVATPGIGYVFTGQGAHWAGMARELLSIPQFSNVIIRLGRYLSDFGCLWDLRQEILDADEARIGKPEHAQSMCTAIQIALIELLRYYHMSPTAVVGHSSGEIAAAYCIGALSARSAMKVAYFRGKLASRLSESHPGSGGMISVNLSPADAAPHILRAATLCGSPPAVVVACVNSPNNVTLSGDAAQVRMLESILADAGIFCRKLAIDVAYHSPQMQEVANDYRRELGELVQDSISVTNVTMFSSVTGSAIDFHDLVKADYWVQNMVSPVQFTSALSSLCSRRAPRAVKKLDLSHKKVVSVNMLVEIGPHSALQHPVNDTLSKIPNAAGIFYASCLTKNTHANLSLLRLMGQVHCIGYDVDLGRVHDSNMDSRSTVLHDLPGYPFDHTKQFWKESRISAQYRLNSQGRLDLLGKPVADWNPLEPRWRNHLRISEMPWIEDHVINGSMIYPGAGMLVMAIEAMNQMADQRFTLEGFELKNVAFVRSIPITHGADGIETQLALHRHDAGSGSTDSWCKFRIFTFEKDRWNECCHGSIRPRYQTAKSTRDQNGIHRTGEAKDLNRLNDFQQTCRTPFDPKMFYKNLSSCGLALGPSFQRVQHGAYHGSKVIADLQLYQWPKTDFPQNHIIHPTTLDAVLHVAIAGYSEGGNRIHHTMVPTFVRSMFIRKEGLASPGTDKINECAWLVGETSRLTKYSGLAFGNVRKHTLIEFVDMECTKIAGSHLNSDQDTGSSIQKAYHVRHLADIDHLSNPQILQHCTADADKDHPMVRYIELLAHKNFNIKILVVGAVVESWEAKLLSKLAPFGTASSANFSQYGQFRHISGSSILPEADDVLSKDFPFVSVEGASILDICTERDSNQSLDLVFLSNDIHIEDDTLHRIKNILRPNGKLVLSDHDSDSQRSRTSWQGLDFCRNGFSDPSLTLSAEAATFTVYKLSGQHRSKSPGAARVTVVYDHSSQQQLLYGGICCRFLQSHCFEVEVLDYREASQNARLGQIYLSLLEIDRPFLYDVSEDEFGLLQTFFRQVRDVIWLNQQGGSTTADPRYCLIHGVSRVLQREHESLQMTILAFEHHEQPSSKQLDDILKILHTHVEASPQRETEYLEINGVLTVPRIFPSEDVSEAIHRRSLRQISLERPVSEAPALKLCIGTAGVLSTLHFIEDQATETKVDDDAIEIQTKAIGLNHEDYLIPLGKDTSISTLGQECSGVVTRAGSKSGFSTGDRVVLGATDLFKTFARGKALQACKIPLKMSFTTAAAIPVQFGTAWEVMNNLVRLQKHESVLVTAAADGTGQAAIQLAKISEASIYVTVDSETQKQLLVDHYHISPDHVFYSNDTDFHQGIKYLTNDRGVDVVINSLSDEFRFASMACVASFGRFVDISKTNIAADVITELSSMGKNVSFTNFDWTSFQCARPGQVQANLRTIIDKFELGILQAPLPCQIFDVSKVEEAIRYLSEDSRSGKVVVEVKDDSRVQMTVKTKPSFQFSADATYVIAGGLGGLGRATARWMAGRGARNLVLLSRSGPRTQSARDLIKELEDQAVQVETPACDVTDLERMQNIFTDLSVRMPPVKGCVQGSIVARDGLFDGLDWHDWHIPVNCKTVGSWNLHSVLPSGMDFFVLLASASGLGGTRGQANYNAGNCYEDALARFRVKQGEKAVALDLGAMRDDGILAEDPELLNRVLGYGSLQPISRETYYALLDYYCDPARALLSPDESQVGFGLGLGGGEGLESFNYDEHPMMYPLQIFGERQAKELGVKVGNLSKDERDFGKDFATAKSLEDASNMVAEAVVRKLSKSLNGMGDWESVDRDQPLQGYGVDSLLAVELRNWIAKEFKADVAVFETQGASTLSTLSFLVAGKSELKHGDWTTAGE